MSRNTDGQWWAVFIIKIIALLIMVVIGIIVFTRG
jgi:hypothetical protein